MLTNEMMLNVDVLGPGGYSICVGDRACALIVAEERNGLGDGSFVSDKKRLIKRASLIALVNA